MVVGWVYPHSVFSFLFWSSCLFLPRIHVIIKCVEKALRYSHIRGDTASIYIVAHGIDIKLRFDARFRLGRAPLDHSRVGVLPERVVLKVSPSADHLANHMRSNLNINATHNSKHEQQGYRGKYHWYSNIPDVFVNIYYNIYNMVPRKRLVPSWS